jgi:hypothetical protein
MYELFYRKHESPETARSEPILLASVLSHSVNANFGVRARALVNKINGVRVIRAFEENTNKEQHLIDFLPDQAIEALDKNRAAEAHSEILKTYGVPKDRRL